MLAPLDTGDRKRHLKVAGHVLVFVPVAAVCLTLTSILANWWRWPVDGLRRSAADWPMWRYDASRSSASPISLPVDLRLQWIRRLPKPAPAWREEQYKLQFDRSYEPVVMGDQIFVPSMVSDKIEAYDTETGRQNWQFFCDGPIRFAPIAWQGRVYFASDDGCLYCLAARDGALLWRSRLAPSTRRVLGNGRLISAWPARGGPVLRDGRIYCSAGIWPFMGVFIYALDAVTGRVIWENSGTGSIYILQQHNSPAFAGVAPQGYLASDGNKLLVTSRTTPACFDCATGELLYYPLADRSYGKHVGGYGASIWKDWYFNNAVAYRLSDGLALGPIAADVMDGDAVAGVGATGEIVGATLAEEQTVDPKDKKTKTRLSAQPVWKVQTEPALDQIHIKAGSRLYGSSDEGLIAAIEAPEGDKPARTVWRARVHGRVWNMVAGDGKLFVITQDGHLYCFGAARRSPVRRMSIAHSLRPAPRSESGRVKEILAQGVDAKGYCLWLGVGNGRLLTELLRQSQMHVIAVEPDAEKVASLRKRLDGVGLYGSRVSILQADVDFADLPPYIASLVVVENLKAAGIEGNARRIDAMCELLRPYSGVAWIAAGKEQQLAICSRLANVELPGFRVDAAKGAVVIQRTGPVPGSADWTHQYGDVANTVCSKDQLRLPLGILWFGEEAGFGDVLPRHGHGPPEQVVGGRLFIQGIDSFSARDVYTGRVLWKKPLTASTFGEYYDASYKHDFRYLGYGQGHIPGANARGTNFVATADRIYVVQEDACHVLDPATGRTQQVFSLPAGEDQGSRRWAYIGVCEDYLIAGANFVRHSPLLKPPGEKPDAAAPFVDWSASRTLIVMNRYDGKVLWSVEADHGFIHNGIAAGGGMVFCLDTVPPYVKRNAREGAEVGQTSRLLAMDLRTGRVVWDNRDSAFGTWLSFSEPFGVLVQAYRKSGDMLWEPGDRMAAFRARTGEVLWDERTDYSGPCMLRGGTVLTQGSAYDLLTGRRRTYPHPLTGEPIPWRYTRNHGCNTAIASENLLTFRSAAAGYYDLTNDGGTGNFGGFRSGCTSNLIVANGVLNAPDYTSTCTCSYQNQTSLAMVHMPDVEMWTFSKVEPSDAPIQSVGINLGAPGDRRAENGTLWLEYPIVGGSSAELDMAVAPEELSWFRRHSSRLRRSDISWVEASGAKGLRSVQVRMSGSQGEPRGVGLGPPAGYTVHLHFMEPENKKAGERRFDVALNGQTVLEDFDIVAEAGSPNVGIVRTFKGIQTSDFVTISLTPTDACSETILCGIEIVAEQPL
ncbi:MAG: PQQ-binding-like beta-propeller repeat protein [Phycisphaerae bacterium]|nr:PQQ-binding-like beta-propeller repeat protein [Phycisphaerae bacterium]